jgi:hypothetical protein
MTIAPAFLHALTRAAEEIPGSQTIPWPVPDNSSAEFVLFANFAEWQKVILDLRLRAGVPTYMTDLFDRALKLHLVAWLDFEFASAGQMPAFAALELSLRDRYLGYFAERHKKRVAATALSEKRSPTLADNFRPEQISLTDLLLHMRKRDGLTDDQLPCVRKYRGIVSVVRLLTGEAKPSLADMRNAEMHGNPFGSGYRSGLLEVVRDLIEYAYRDAIQTARGNGSQHYYGSELPLDFDDPGSMQNF